MRNRRYKTKTKIARSLGSWIREIIFVFLLAFVFVFFCFQIAFVHGHDMKPAWQDGDMVLINKIQYMIEKPERLDVALIQVESGGNRRSIVRRIVGLPGETVQIREGDLYVKGQKIILGSGVSIKTPGIAQEPIQLKANEYFVLCDNYNRGEDSRMTTIGIIKKKQIVGKVMDVKAIINNILKKYNLL